MAQPEDDAAANWNSIDDDSIGRIVAHVDPAALRFLALVEKRICPFATARLRSLATPRLHELARRGDAQRISDLFHIHSAPVFLLFNDEHTILHTAIEARQLDLVQWLVQPLSYFDAYTPLSSNIIDINGNLHVVSMMPRALPEEQCRRLFDIDGPDALRAAAAVGDLDLIDRLLPCANWYPATRDLPPDRQERLSFGCLTRELVIELRDLLLNPITTTTHTLQAAGLAAADVAAAQAALQAMEAGDDPQGLGLQALVGAIGNELTQSLHRTRQSVHVLDRRLRSSDIEQHFKLARPAELQRIKEREEAAEAEGGFFASDWRWADDPYTPSEKRGMSQALEVAVAADRIDLATWLIDSWDAVLLSLPRVRLSELTLVERLYDVERLLKLPTPHTEINRHNIFVEMAVDNWQRQNTYTCDVSGVPVKGARYRRTPRDEYEEDYDLCEAEYDKLGAEEQARYVRFAPPPPKDCASLARVIKKEIARIEKLMASKERCVSDGDEKFLKKLLERIEPTTSGHEAMLVFLESREYGHPRLSVVVCAGAVWALRWLLDSQLISLCTRFYPRKGFSTQAQGCGHLQRQLSVELRKLAPWLASAVSQYAREGEPLTLGIVLAALAVSRGALALVEMLVAEGINVATLRLAGDRTLLHVVVRHAPKHAVIWLVEHGPAEWLTKRSAAGTSPLHEAILTGHVPVVYYLLEQGGAAGDDPADPKCVPWDELGVRSEHEAIRKIAEEHRGKIACSVLLPQILRAPEGSVADVEARLDALLKQHASALDGRLGSFRGSEALYTQLIRTALDGGRGPTFMRWLYVTSGLFRHSGINQRVLHRDESRDTHLKLWRELAREHGGPEGAAPEVTAALDELSAAEEHAEALSTQLYDLDKKLVRLWEVGATVSEIESVQHQINQLLVTAPPSEKDKDKRVTVFGMNMSKVAGHWKGAEGLVFRVKEAACDADASDVLETADDDKGQQSDLGHFDLLAACALNGHLHLVHYLLGACGAGVKECWLDRLPVDVLKQIQGPTLGEGPTSRVASALVTTLQWNGPLAAVQALCAHLEQRGVDLNAIQILRDPGMGGIDSEVGVLDNALLGILHERSLQGNRMRCCGSAAMLLPVEHTRLDFAFATVSWLAAHTKAKLRPGAFADFLNHYILRGDMGTSYLCAFRGPTPDEPEEVRLRHLDESQALVLRLTRLCVEELGATWSDKSVVHSNRSRAGDTALQRLTNGGWMKAVGWLGRERGAPLQGLILDPLHRAMHGDLVAQQHHAEALRQLREEQARSWVRAEGAL